MYQIVLLLLQTVHGFSDIYASESMSKRANSSSLSFYLSFLRLPREICATRKRDKAAGRKTRNVRLWSCSSLPRPGRPGSRVRFLPFFTPFTSHLSFPSDERLSVSSRPEKREHDVRYLVSCTITCALGETFVGIHIADTIVPSITWAILTRYVTPVNYVRAGVLRARQNRDADQHTVYRVYSR